MFDKSRLLSYAYLKNELKVSRPRDFIRDNLEGGVYLSHAYLHLSVLDETHALIREVCGLAKEGLGGCLNLETALSVPTTSQDVDDLIDSFPQKKNLFVASTFVMKKPLLVAI